MPPPKPARRRGKKSNKVLEQPRPHWVLDNQTRRSCKSDRERRLWDLQDQLLALRGESKARQLSKVDEAIAFLYPYRGHAEQLEALRWLLFEEKDMILVAKTSFGKSMIMQAMPCLYRASVVIIILPLNAIGAEQKAKIEELPGTRPVHVFTETISARLLREIRIGVYTHILISPEMLVGKRFHKILTNPTFRAHVGLVVIDEVHLVANWGGSFRSSYTQLWKVRSLLGRRPWFACTATLDDTTFKIVQELAGFRNNINIVRTSIDRPDLSIIREYVKRGNKKSFKSLYFVIDRAYKEAPVRNLLSASIGQLSSRISATSAEQGIQYTPTPHRIPKTIIFLDSKDMISLARNSIRSWLVHHGYQEAQARRAVQLYHASLADADKDRLYEEFRKPNSEIRILVSSDALAHGADIPDIDRAVQYCMHKDKHINMTWQRFGRAARGNGHTGEAIFLIEDWYKGPRGDIAGPAKNRGRTGRAFRSQPSQLSREYRVEREISQQVSQEDGVADFASDISSRVSVCSDADPDPSASDIGRELSPGGTSVVLPADILPKKPAQRPKTDAEKRAALSHCMYAFANEGKGCLRKIILENYKEQSPSTGGQGCCSNCDPTLRAFKEFDIREPHTERIPRKMQQKAFAVSIKNWFCNWVEKKYQHTVWNPTSSCVISDKQITALCSCAWYITSQEALKKNLPDWNCDQLGGDLDEFVVFIQAEAEKQHQVESQLLASASKSKDSAERILPRSRVAERRAVSAAQSPQTQVVQLPQLISAENPHAGPTPLPSEPTSSRNAQLASPNSSQQNTSRTSTPKPHNGYQSWQRDDRVQFLTQGGYPGSQSQARSQVQRQAGYQQPWGNNQRQLLSGIEYRHPTPLGYQSLYYNRHQLPTAPGYPSLHHSIRNQSLGQARYYYSQGSSASQPLEQSGYQSSQRSIGSQPLEQSRYQGSQQSIESQPLEQPGYQSSQHSIESESLGQSECQSLQCNTESQLLDKPGVQYSQHSTGSPITKNSKVQDPQHSTSSHIVRNPEI